MKEPKSGSNCKFGYVDDLFYEYCCRLSRCRPDLDEDGFPVENTKCKKWKGEKKMKRIIIVCPNMEGLGILYNRLLELAYQLKRPMRGFIRGSLQKAEMHNDKLSISIFLANYKYLDGLRSDYHYIMNCEQETSRWYYQLRLDSIELNTLDEVEAKIQSILCGDHINAAIKAYMDTDIAETRALYTRFHHNNIFSIKNVIFNDPATIVFWSDGTKTVVKAQDGDIFDPEKGLAMAISKKALGNKGNYCNELKKWLPKEEEPWQPTTMTELAEGIQKLSKKAAEVFGVK